MRSYLRRWAPEFGLAALTIFFSFRELATFPAAWEDSGIYTLVARSLAEGYGYTLPILDQRWAYPYFLSVGPTVIGPVALMIYLFGFSLEVARIVPVTYLILTTVVFYLFVRDVAGLWSARWGTALLITLSAYVNSGKPVLGSVPALFFVFLGLLVWNRLRPSWKSAVAVGSCFGLAILTKFTFILILPALGFAAVFLRNRTYPHWEQKIIKCVVAIAIFAPWILLELNVQPGFDDFLVTIFTRAGDGGTPAFLLEKLLLFTRFQYLYFLVLLVVGIVGISDRTLLRLREPQRIFLATLLGLFVAYFLSREGWYRHLLPAHVLLLATVPIGFLRFLPKPAVNVILLFFITAQGFWQLDHRGSSRSTAAAEAASIIEERYPDQDLLVQHPEIFVRLPENPHWLYYPLRGTRELLPEAMIELSPEQQCFFRIRKPKEEDVPLLGSDVLESGTCLSPRLLLVLRKERSCSSEGHPCSCGLRSDARDFFSASPMTDA